MKGHFNLNQEILRWPGKLPKASAIFNCQPVLKNLYPLGKASEKAQLE
jgi:hypothetical protein